MHDSIIVYIIKGTGQKANDFLPGNFHKNTEELEGDFLRGGKDGRAPGRLLGEESGLSGGGVSYSAFVAHRMEQQESGECCRG